jgi:hypothetical protein
VELNENLVMWGSLVGTAMPMLISVLNKPQWDSTTKGIVALIACVIAALGTVYFEGRLSDGGDLVSAFLAVFITAVGTYNLYFKPSGISGKIERSTSGI